MHTQREASGRFDQEPTFATHFPESALGSADLRTRASDAVDLADAGDVLNVRDVQRILGIGRNATYELLASGRLPSIRVTTRRIIVTKKALEVFLGLSSK